MVKNTLRSELKLAKQYGFSGTAKNSISRNPYLRLVGGHTLVWLPGNLLSLVTTCTYFGTGQYLKAWKSSNRNEPYATMTTTQLNDSGVGTHTEIYYREIYKHEIAALARRYNIPESEVVVDHINHKRGDNRDTNLRLATTAQNNQNRSDVKITNAFYTLEDLEFKLASGEWIREEICYDA
jgi:hypothetical protein